jgi:hypothetical protein
VSGVKGILNASFSVAFLNFFKRTLIRLSWGTIEDYYLYLPTNKKIERIKGKCVLLRFPPLSHPRLLFILIE